MTYSSFLMDCVDEWADEAYTQDEDHNDWVTIRHDEMIDSILDTILGPLSLPGILQDYFLEKVFGGDK